MNYRISDKSGDKKYFTIIPNYVLNHSTLYDREVYIQMKRYAGENGTCYSSKETLANQCGISKRRLDKSVKYLVEHGWIKKIGNKRIKTFGGRQVVNEFEIVDLWQMNNDFYQKGVHQKHPLSKRGCTDDTKGGAPPAPKEEPIQEDNNFDIEEGKKQIREKMQELNLKKKII